MTLYAIFALAVALAMDAFAVAMATGIRLGAVSRRQSFRLAFHFGLFQFMMPVLGWVLGLTVRDFIEAWDHWVAFGLLALVGLNMLRETFFPEKQAVCAVASPDSMPDKASLTTSAPADPTRGFSLIMLSVATSIDALAVGLSFSMLKLSVWFPAVVIGVVCFVLTALGLQLGKSLCQAEALAKRAEMIGGIVLLGIGVKILFDHGVFGG